MQPKKAKKASTPDRRVSWQYKLFLFLCVIVVVAMIISMVAR